MNLTLVFIVLSIGIAYMLYDTFKKSRQGIATNTKQTSKLKINYSKDCKILRQLYQNKVSQYCTKTISIHLKKQFIQFKGIEDALSGFKNCCRIFFLRESGTQQEYQINHQGSHIISYNSIEGAVAILRQLNCSIHIETDAKIAKIIKQYLQNIWYVGQDSEDTLRYFKNFEQMLKVLGRQSCKNIKK